MTNCIVKSCRNSSRKNKRDPGVTLHGFPCSLERIKQWLQKIPQDFGDLNAFAQRILDSRKRCVFRICSAHFLLESYISQGMKLTLKEDAVPTVFPARRIKVREDGTNTRPSKRMKGDPAGAQPPGMNKRQGSTETEQTNREDCASIFSSPKDRLKHTLTFKRMVDASTSTDPECFRVDQGIQWPEYEFNFAGEPWKIQHDHFYLHHNTPVQPKKKHDVGPEQQECPYNTGDTNYLYEADSSLDFSQSSLMSKSQTSHKATVQVPEPHCSTAANTHPFMKRDISESDMACERKFIVFESCLDALFYKLSCGFGSGCRAHVIGLEKHVDGTFLSVIGRCERGHRFHLWNSQPFKGPIAAGNLLTAAALLFSGSNFSKVREMSYLLGLQQISAPTYYEYQRSFLFPTIDLHWQQERQRLKDAYISTPLTLAGECQSNIPGYSDQFCTCTVIDVATKKILDFQIEQFSESTSSIIKERTAFKNCLNRVMEEQFDVKAIVTDRHPWIKDVMYKKYGYLQHHYDVWQYAKGVKKQLKAVSRKRTCSELEKWIPAITNHLSWSSSTCHGNLDLLRERWLSLLTHIVDKHEWYGAKLYPACVHKPLTPYQHSCHPWLKRRTPAFHALREMVVNPQMIMDLSHLSQFYHTGEIEVYRSFILKYRPKTMHLKMDAMEARTKLAALAHNANVHRWNVRFYHTRKGRGMFGAERPNFSERWLAKPLYEKAASEHVLPMMSDVLRICTSELSHSWHSRTATERANLGKANWLVIDWAVSHHYSH
ncbi:uncharacterized protein WCC33_014890 [Rhinophrynus dorsalis]